MRSVNLHSAFLVGVLALSLGGCASNGSGSSTSSSKAGTSAPKQEVSSEAEMAFEQALGALDAGQFDKAETMLKDMTKTYPTLSGPYLNLGIIYIKQEKLDDALKVLKTAVEVNPSNIDACNELAWVYREKANFAKAEETYLTGLAQNDADLQLNYNLGVLYDLFLQNPQKALYYYQRYLENAGEEDKRVQAWIKELQSRG